MHCMSCIGEKICIGKDYTQNMNSGYHWVEKIIDTFSFFFISIF